MKFIKGLLLMSSLFVIFSCVTTEKATVTEGMESEKATTAEGTGKTMVETIVKEKVYFPVKELTYYGDGQIDTVTTYTYNDNFNLIQKVQTNEQGEVLESHVMIIENGTVIRENSFGFGNVLNSYTVFEYDADNNIVSENLFDKEDKIQSSNVYEYINGNRVNWRTLGPTGGVLAITTYVYDDQNNNIKIEMKDAGGAIDGVIEKTYMDGHIAGEEIFNSKGVIEKSATYTYKMSSLLEKIYFDDKGKKKRSETYEYTDSKPVPVKINQNYRSGNLEAYTEVEYDFRIIESTIMVEE